MQVFGLFVFHCCTSIIDSRAASAKAFVNQVLASCPPAALALLSGTRPPALPEYCRPVPSAVLKVPEHSWAVQSPLPQTVLCCSLLLAMAT